MNKVLEYFDLGSDARRRQAAIQPLAAANGQPQEIHWLPQYIALLLGILVQPMFQKYMATGKWDVNGFGGWLIASAVVSAMAFPGVYKKTFEADKPLFVQLCVIFTAGTGWQTLVSTALKSAGVVNAVNPGST